MTDKKKKAPFKKSKKPKPLIDIEIPEQKKIAKWSLPESLLEMVSDYQAYQIELVSEGGEKAISDKHLPEELIVETILRDKIMKDKDFKKWLEERDQIEFNSTQ